MSDVVKEMTKFEFFLFKIKRFLILTRMKYIPYLVWYDQEIDCQVNFKEDRLNKSGNAEQAFYKLQSGHLHEIEKNLHEIGITFDKGIGLNGRDWEWDFSLKGPISLKFKGTHKTNGRGV